MSSEGTLDLCTATFEKNLESIAEAMSWIIDDEDYNGDNGDGYIWEVAREAGYESSQEYVEKKILEDYKGEEINWTKIEWICSDVVEMIESHDSYYRFGPSDLIELPDGRVKFYVAVLYGN